MSNVNESLDVRGDPVIQDGNIGLFVGETHDGFGDSELETMIDLQQNNYVVLDTIGSQFINQCGIQNQNVRAQVHELEVSTNESNCKCLDKLRNKMDYFQKRMIGEMADLRHDMMKSIRNLTDIVLRGSSNQQPTQDTPDEDDNSHELIEKYAGHIPVNDKIALRAINQRIKADAEFKKFLQLEFERISAVDAVKTARKMLNAVCTVSCFGQFTWLGTKDKDRFSELQFLIEFITKILESRFTNCGAYKIIESVVKQRTKSAGEAVKENFKGASKCQEGTANSHFSVESSETPELPFVADDPMLHNEHPAPFDPESVMHFYE